MSGRKFNLERVELPNWVGSVTEGAAADRLGEQAEWAFAIPWVFQALAAPRARTPFVRAPEPGDDSWPIALGYWTSLLHLLVYGFGWSRPDLGLLRWYDNDRPVDDPKLALMDEIWHTDGQLDWFAAWLWTSGACDSLLDPYNAQVDRTTTPEMSWLDQIALQVETSRTPAPFGGPGGSDPLHLSPHTRAPLEATPPYGAGRLSYDQTGKRQATLVLDSMTGWYRALSEAADHLIESRGEAWAVDVIATTVGHLGMFRHSRTTGLWYSGRHRHHLRRN